MSFTIQFTDLDLVRCHFTVSPLWETEQAVERLRFPWRSPALGTWLRFAAGRLKDVELWALDAVMPPRGYHPDFLVAPVREGSTTIDAQLRIVRSAPLCVVDRELRQCRTLHQPPSPARWMP